MSQSRDDDFYSSSTEFTERPPHEGFSQQDLSEMSTIEQLNFPQPNPGNQPGIQQVNSPQTGSKAAAQHAPQQRPANQPGSEPQRPGSPFPVQHQRPLSQPNPGQQLPPRSTGQPGFAPASYPGQINQQRSGSIPQNFASQRPDEQSNRGSEQAHFPPPSGPISQPGFSPAESASNPPQGTNQAGNSALGGSTIPAWEQARPPEQSAQQATVAAWGQQARPPEQPAQQSTIPAWQLPSSASNSKIADWPTIVQPPAETKPQRSKLMLVIALVGLALLIIGSGTFVLISQKNKSVPPASQNTVTAQNPTSVATHAAPAHPPTTSAGGLNGINTPVQAGTDWIATITSARTTRSSLIQPNPGKTYLELHLTLKNTSAKKLTVISILEFVLSDSSGQRYSEIATDTNVRRTPDGNVNPQQTLNAQLAYEVPTAQHSFILTFAYGLGSNSNSSVSWEITV